MKFGLALQNYVAPGESVSMKELVSLSSEAERLGFDSIWVWDHIFLGSKTVFPIHDSLTVLTAAAFATKKVSLGTGILVLPLRNPVELAKRVATIDNLSGGRVRLGVAAGWYEREFQALGVPFASRGKAVELGVEVMRRLWAEDRISGRFGPYEFRNISMEPKPVQKPGPPVWMGGYTEKVHQRIAKLADGWVSYFYPPESFAKNWARISEYVRIAGRDTLGFGNCDMVPARVEDNIEDAMATTKAFVDKYCDLPAWSEATVESAVAGSGEDCRRAVNAYSKSGVQELVFMPAVKSLSEIRDQVRRLSEEVVANSKVTG
jgi:probable F420-dependent oxidoreductase